MQIHLDQYTNFGSVNHKRMRENEPQRCVQQH